jgi:electron transport complex protein RnfG
MMRAMVGIGLACGLLIVTVFQGTAPVIAANRAELLQRAIFEVLPEATSSKSYALAGGDRFEPMGEGESTLDADARVVHAGYDDEQRLVGFALEASAMGYADLITLLYGYDHREQQVVGMVVLQSKETPGLGDRIETEPDFVANFAALDVSLDDSGAAKQNPIAAVKQGTKQHPWEVDGITGATISSKAVVAALERSTSFWAPRLRARLADFVAEDSP